MSKKLRQAQPDKLLLTPGAAAYYLGISEPALRSLTEHGLIKSVNISFGSRKHYRYTRAFLDSYIESEGSRTASILKITSEKLISVKNNNEYNRPRSEYSDAADAILRRKGII